MTLVGQKMGNIRFSRCIAQSARRQRPDPPGAPAAGVTMAEVCSVDFGAVSFIQCGVLGGTMLFWIGTAD
jgi:hypothetical protein